MSSHSHSTAMLCPLHCIPFHATLLLCCSWCWRMLCVWTSACADISAMHVAALPLPISNQAPPSISPRWWGMEPPAQACWLEGSQRGLVSRGWRVFSVSYQDFLLQGLRCWGHPLKIDIPPFFVRSLLLFFLDSPCLPACFTFHPPPLKCFSPCLALLSSVVDFASLYLGPDQTPERVSDSNSLEEKTFGTRPPFTPVL